MSQPDIRVLVVDDHDMIRNGLAILLEAFDDLCLVGAAANGAEALRLCDKREINVALVGLSTPKLSSIAAIRTLRQRHPQVQVVALISFGDEELLEDIVQAGAAGYLLKNAPIDNIAETIRAAARGSTSRLGTAPESAPPARPSHDPSGIQSHSPPAP